MGTQPSVLIVDDSKFARMLLAKAINNFSPDTTVFQAKDGEEGFNMFQENTPDIVMVDYHMPGINGVQLIEKLRETGTTVPIALCTANIQNSIQDQAKEMNVAFVAKPITDAVVHKFLEETDKFSSDR